MSYILKLSLFIYARLHRNYTNTLDGSILAVLLNQQGGCSIDFAVSGHSHLQTMVLVTYNSEAKCEYATTLREWTPLAEQGDANAQSFLGVMYEYGQGVPQNYKTAVKWYTPC